MDDEANECVEACPAGFAPDDNMCTACAQGKFADHLAHSCVDACSENSKHPYHDEAARDCVGQCPPGYAPSTDNRLCTNCQDDSKYADHEAANCVDKCPTGWAPSAEFDCVDCGKDRKFADHEGNRCVDQCPSGFSGDVDTRDCVTDDDESRVSRRSR
eukprot:TRINITY_DN3904_c0_g2_i12.p3 TRINITY_DN3904_c0_g2~~TRINITY_DN3904_c0_g2_i12.p3  ORF type:complete len:158 (+),score=30.85 TRINITY_DN3904_c0_g2_i12:724-1197(+)